MTTSCCGKCFIPGAQIYAPGCSDRACPCHKETEPKELSKSSLGAIEPSYHQRFRERFDETYFAELATEAHYGDLATNAILTFIDEVVAGERARAAKEYHHAGDVLGYSRGKRETRYTFIEKIEGMRLQEEVFDGSEVLDRTDAVIRAYKMAHNKALDDLLTHLRASQPNA